VVGDEAVGIENLLGCSDEGLKGVAKLEGAKPATPEAMVDLAEAWVALAGKEEALLHKRRYQSRGKLWFDEALKNAGGILRTKIERRLADLQRTDSSGGSKKSSAIDLLAKIDPKKDATAGNWRRAGVTLLGTGSGPHAICMLNYTPPEGYDLTLVIERKEGVDDFFVGLIGGGNQVAFCLDAYKSTASGPANVDGKAFNENGLGVKGKVFENGKPRTVTFLVRKESLIVQVDGREFFNWKAEWKRVSVHPNLAVPKKDTLFIGTYESTWAVSKIALTPAKN
jgi:hypothetical protein